VPRVDPCVRVSAAIWLLAFLIEGCGAPTQGGAGIADAEPADGASSPPDAGRGDGRPEDAGDGGNDGDPPSSGVDPTCTVPGCVRALVEVGRFDRDFLEPLLDPGVSIDNGYTVHTLRYVTRDLGGGATDTEEPVEVLATITLPLRTASPGTGFPIVVNAHGTTGVGDDCAVTGTVGGTGLAGLFGARGVIGIAPDYPGLGVPGPHPYLVAGSAGPAMLDAVRAARRVARHLGVSSSHAAAIVGFSQGGHAALSAARYRSAHASEIDLRGVAVSGPATAWITHWRPGLLFDGPHLRYHALLVHSWSVRRGVGLDLVFAPELVDGISSDIEAGCLFPPRPGIDDLDDALPITVAGLFRADFVDAFLRPELPGFGLLSDAFAENAVSGVPVDVPVAVYQGALDDVVPPAFTEELVTTLRADGVSVLYDVVPDGRHDDVAFGPLAEAERRTAASVSWVLDQLR